MGERVLLAEGREAEVFLQADGTVLKLLRQPGDGGRVEREAAALRALAAAGIAAPAVVGTVEVDGRPGLVTTRVEGTNLLDLLGRRPLSVLAAGRVMGAAHAAMHEIVAPADLPDLKDLLAGRIAAADLAGGRREAALALLDALPGGDRLCHGDFHLGNMIGTWAHAEVIDWGDAARGDPVADVARTELLHRIGEPGPGTPAFIRAVAPVGRGLLTDRYLATYRRHRPLDGRLVDRWRVVRAAARLAEPIPEERPKLLAVLDRGLEPAG